MFSFLLGIYVGVELQGHKVILYLTFWGTAKLFCKALALYEGSNFSTKSPIFVTVCLLDNGHPGRCEVVSQFILIHVFLMTNDVKHLWVYWSFVALFREMPIQPFAHLCLGYLSLHCWLVSSLYILDRNSSSDLQSDNTFSHSVDCIFTFLKVLSETQTFNIILIEFIRMTLVNKIIWSTNFLIFNKVQFIYFSFVTCSFGVILKKPLPNLRSWRFIPMFSFKSSTVFSSYS